MSLTLENPETGQAVTLMPDSQGRYPNFKLPWKVKGEFKPAKIASPIETVIRERAKVEKLSFWERYPYRKCSACGEMAVYEST